MNDLIVFDEVKDFTPEEWRLVGEWMKRHTFKGTHHAFVAMDEGATFEPDWILYGKADLFQVDTIEIKEAT